MKNVYPFVVILGVTLKKATDRVKMIIQVEIWFKPDIN